MTNTRNGREAGQTRKAGADDRHEDWEKLTNVQKLQQLVDRGHGHTKHATRLKQEIVDARAAKGDV